MNAVRVISLILLAAYLIFSGLVSISGAAVSGYVNDFIGLCAAVSGVLMLICVRSFVCDHE